MATQQSSTVPTTHDEWLAAYRATPERDAEFLSLSGEEVAPLYTAADVNDAPDHIGLPGAFPYTRGVYPSMYRGRLWTMRQFAGVGTLDDMQDLFKGIDLGEVSVSMTINAPAAIMMAFYVVAAERQGVSADNL